MTAWAVVAEPEKKSKTSESLTVAISTICFNKASGLGKSNNPLPTMLRIDCWEAEKDLKTTPGSDCALTSLAVDEPLEYARLYLEGNLQMWVDAEDSLEL